MSAPTESDYGDELDSAEMPDISQETYDEIHEDAVFFILASKICELRELRGVSIEQLAKGARIPVELLRRFESEKLQPQEMTARQLISVVLELHGKISIQARKKRVRVPKPPKNQA